MNDRIEGVDWLKMSEGKRVKLTAGQLGAGQLQAVMEKQVKPLH